MSPQLGRWVTADPLAVHVPGRADFDLYAYVSGAVLAAVDPVGLENQDNTGGASGKGVSGTEGASGSPSQNATSSSATPGEQTVVAVGLARDTQARIEQKLAQKELDQLSKQAATKGMSWAAAKVGVKVVALATAVTVLGWAIARADLMGQSSNPLPDPTHAMTATPAEKAAAEPPATQTGGADKQPPSGPPATLVPNESPENKKGAKTASVATYHKHHTIPREILKQLPPDVAKAVRGKAGAPNRWSIPEDVHKAIHKGPGGGAYNDAFKQRLQALGRDPTAADVTEIRK